MSEFGNIGILYIIQNSRICFKGDTIKEDKRNLNIEQPVMGCPHSKVWLYCFSSRSVGGHNKIESIKFLTVSYHSQTIKLAQIFSKNL